MIEIAYICNGKQHCGGSKNCKINRPKDKEACCSHTTDCEFSAHYNSSPSNKILNNKDIFDRYVVKGVGENSDCIKYYEKEE